MFYNKCACEDSRKWYNYHSFLLRAILFFLIFFIEFQFLASAFVNSISLLVFHFMFHQLWFVTCCVSNVFFFPILNLVIYKKSKNNTQEVMIGKIWRKTPSLLLRNPQTVEFSLFPLVKQRLVHWEPSSETVSSTLRSHDGGHHEMLGETIP